jgi:hypothetical protein
MRPIVEELRRLKREHIGGFSAQDAKRLEIISGHASSPGQRKGADRGLSIVQVGRKADEFGELLIRRKIQKRKIPGIFQRIRRDHLPLERHSLVRLPSDCKDLLSGDEPRRRKPKRKSLQDLLHPARGEEVDEAAGIEQKKLTFGRWAQHAGLFYRVPVPARGAPKSRVSLASAPSAADRSSRWIVSRAPKRSVRRIPASCPSLSSPRCHASTASAIYRGEKISSSL